MATIEKRSRISLNPSNKSKNSETIYRAKIRLKGIPSQSATFDRLSDAKAWVQKTESEIRMGRYQMLSEAQRHTLAQLIERYIEEVIPQKAETTVKTQTSYLRWWKSKIGELRLSEVKPPVLSSLKTELSKTKSPATVTYYLASLSHCFSIAMREWHWMDSNPLRMVSKPKLPQGRVRYLDENERSSLFSTIKQSHCHYLHVIVLIALSTGARKMEIMNLRWRDVDFGDGGRLTIQKTKNRERKVLPMIPQVFEQMEVFSRVRRIDTDFVFPREDGKKSFDIRKAWEKAVREASLKDFCFHDLRHSAASYLAMNGASPSEIAAVLGHKTLSMVKRYAHVGEVHTAEVVKNMTEKFLNEKY